MKSKDIKRFFSKIEKTNTCWFWVYSLRNGYGAFWDGIKHGDAHKKITYKSGADHCNALLSVKNVIKIRKLYKSNLYSWNQLARKFKISKRAIGRVIHKETYSNVKS